MTRRFSIGRCSRCEPLRTSTTETTSWLGESSSMAVNHKSIDKHRKASTAAVLSQAGRQGPKSLRLSDPVARSTVSVWSVVPQATDRPQQLSKPDRWIFSGWASASRKGRVGNFPRAMIDRRLEGNSDRFDVDVKLPCRLFKQVQLNIAAFFLRGTPHLSDRLQRTDQANSQPRFWAGGLGSRSTGKG